MQNPFGDTRRHLLAANRAQHPARFDAGARGGPCRINAAHDDFAADQPHIQTDMVFSPLPEVPLESTPCQGYWFQDVPVLDQPDRDGALKPFGLSWEGAEVWLDRIGYETKPGMTMRELLNP